MRKIIYTFFLSIFILPPCLVYAGNSSIVANYPAPSGTYNKVVLQGLYTTPDCTAQASGAYINAGLLYMYTDSNGYQTLAMCNKDGTGTRVDYPETCFNRFWNSPQNPSTPNGCPKGYSSTSTTNTLTADSNTVIKVTVCCSNTYGVANPTLKF
jgi:hypothetical protein